MVVSNVASGTGLTGIRIDYTANNQVSARIDGGVRQNNVTNRYYTIVYV